jgi:epoxyqueuosine reductase
MVSGLFGTGRSEGAAGHGESHGKKSGETMERFEEWMAEEIRHFVRDDPTNRLERLDGSAIFGEPLVGYAAGDDAIFDELKQVIGEFHLTPQEVMTAAAERRGLPVPRADELGVISFVLPLSNQTRRENARSKDHPSERWSHTRLFGEECKRKLETHVVSLLEERGFLAVAPEHDEELFRIFIDETVGWTSRWSQRHVAFAAGLGSFGLSDGLITPVGKAHRVGSVVVGRRLESSPRPEDIHRDCLSYRGLSCRKCMKRCPVGAITEDGHDKARCMPFVFEQIPFIKEHYDIEIYACGLCQAGVPCERGIPKAGEESG